MTTQHDPPRKPQPVKKREVFMQLASAKTGREEEMIRIGVKAGVAMALEVMRELHTGKAAKYLEDGALTSLWRKVPIREHPAVNAAIRKSTQKKEKV